MTAFRTILAFAALAGTPAPQKPANAAFHALGDLPGGAFESMAQAISANGSIIVGAAATAAGPQAHRGFRWTPRQGMFELRTHDQPVREALAVSADGSTIVGDRGQHAFRSTAQGTDDLGTLPGRANSRAIAVSADGSVVTGSSYELPAWNTEEAYVCTKTAGMQGLGYLPGEKSSFPNAISPEGSVIAGASGAAAFRWTRGNGMVAIGSLPGRRLTHPAAISANGAIIVGAAFAGREDAVAFIWDAAHGMRSLQKVLETECGLSLTGWNLENASGITPDGSVVVGWGWNPSGNREAFRAVLGAPGAPPRSGS